MSNEITQAVVSGIAASFDPNAAPINEAITATVVKLKLQNVEAKTAQMLRIQGLIEEAGDKARPSVLKAYEDMLQQVVSM